MVLFNKTGIIEKLGISTQRKGDTYAKTEEKRRRKMHKAEHKHGAGAATTVVGILPEGRAHNFLGDTQGIGTVSW